MISKVLVAKYQSKLTQSIFFPKNKNKKQTIKKKLTNSCTILTNERFSNGQLIVVPMVR